MFTMKTFAIALAVLMLRALAVAADPPPVLQLHLNFDQSPQSASKDETGARAVEYHRVSFVDGPFGKAGSFNGKKLDDGGSAVLLPGAQNQTFFKNFNDGPFTVECWFKLDADADEKGTFDLVNAANAYGPGWRLYYTWKSLAFVSGLGEKEIDGKPGFWSVGTNPLNCPVLLNTWHHLAAVRDNGGILSLYYDGMPAARSEGKFRIAPAKQMVCIGAGAGGTIFPFKGQMDEVRIYRGGRSAEQILIASQGIEDRIGIRMDGKLDEKIWKSAARFGDFKFHRGGKKSDVQTEVLVANDADNLYFGLTAHEPRMNALVDTVRENSLRVFHDDSLEIMLAADGDQADFYHFLVNPSGFRGQELRVQGGNVGDRWENDAWFAATSKESDRWVTEIAIPLAVLNREGHPLTETMKFNVARNRRAASTAGGEIESSLAGGAIVRSARFLDYRLANVDPAHREAQAGVVKLADAHLDEGALAANVSVPLRNPGDSAMNLELLAVMMSNGEQAAARARAELAAGGEQMVTIPFRLKQPGVYTLFLFGRSGGKLVLADRREIDVSFIPLVIDIKRPFFRDTIYATETISDLAADVRIGLADQTVGDAALNVALTNDAGATIVQQEIAHPKREQDMVLSVSELPAGRYLLVATLKRGSETLAQASRRIQKLNKPAAGNEVRIDSRNRLIVNGQPRLPIMWWTNDIAGIAETGADSVLTDAESSGILDQLHAKGLMAVVSLMHGATADRFIHGKTELSPEGRAFITEKINRLREHSAVLCWFLKDEPEVTGDNPAVLQAMYDLVVELDPYHPIAITNDTVRGLHSYADAQDIFLPDPYILPLKNGKLDRGMNYIALFMDEAMKAGKGRKLVGHTPQVFNYGDHGQYNGRAPTFVEQRCQQYLSIIHGARFLSYYKFDFMKGYPELEYGVPELIKEIRMVSPVVLQGELLAGVKSSSPAIHLLALKQDGKEFILACNVEPRAISVKISVPAGTDPFQVLSEERTVQPQDGVLADQFAPYATHIYSTDPSLNSPISLKQVQATIERRGGVFNLIYGEQ